MEFVKYQGTGNDFILIDDRSGTAGEPDVAALCHRRFGIGADGLMLLQLTPEYDFKMVYYNSDGNLSSMCGNGGRCIAHFAHTLGIGNNGRLDFIAVDGPHTAIIEGNIVTLGMKDVDSWDQRSENVVVLNTGSPHFVEFINQDPAAIDVVSAARAIRYNTEFASSGINVNFVHVLENGVLRMRTYERGVEDETFSCGTGVTAAAIAYSILYGKNPELIEVHTPGGNLQVKYTLANNIYSAVTLRGPAMPVFVGEY